MKKFLLALLCITIVCININGQQKPFLQWQKTYGYGYSFNKANSIQETADNGYIIAGQSFEYIHANHGSDDYWIVKTDPLGNIQWQKALGGSNYDFATSIQQTRDGGYIVAGYTYSNDGDVTGNHGQSDYWIIKLDALGNIQWQKALGGGYDDVANSIQQTTDGGYIVAGYSYSNNGDVTGNHGNTDYWIVKLNAVGSIQWQKSFGGSLWEEARSVQQTTDGGYVIAGESDSHDGDFPGNFGNYDYHIIKLDVKGNIQWKKNMGGTGDDYANSIQQTSDGGYIVAGSSNSNNYDVTGNHGSDDYWIVKLTASGNRQWNKTFGGSNSDKAYGIQQTTDGGYIIAGSSSSDDWDVKFFRGWLDYWIVKLDAVANMEWQKTFGGSLDEEPFSIYETADKGYIVAGYSRSSDGNVTGHGTNEYYWIVKLSPETLNDSITIFPYHLAKQCAGTSDVSCDIRNKNKAYTVRLYRFGEIYDSAINVTGHTGFHNLPQGAYYVTATDGNGVVNYSEEVAVEPIPTNTVATNITATTAQLNWSGFNCTDDYRVQFRVQGKTDWQERQTNGNVTSYTLNNLKPSTTYVWKVGSRKRQNGIQAKGKFSDSVVFATASAITATNQSNITTSNNSKTLLLTVSPNPAKNYFVINFKDDSQQKINAVLYDVNGKTIWTSGLVNAKALNGKQVNASQFAKEVFYLKVTNENGELIGSTKIVIAK